MEDKLSASTSDIVIAKGEISNKSPTNKNNKSKKDDHESKKSWFSFFKRSSRKDTTGPKASKKSKSVSNFDDDSSISSNSAVMPILCENVTFGPVCDIVSLKSNTDTEQIPCDNTSPDADNGVTPSEDDVTTPDKDEKAATVMETVDTTSDNGTIISLLKESVVSEREEVTESAMSNDDAASTTNDDTGPTLDTCTLNDSGSQGGVEYSATHCSSTSLDDRTSCPDVNDSCDVDDVHVADVESTAVSTEDRMTSGDTAEPCKGVKIDDEKILERRLTELRDLVETEKAYVQDLCAVFNNIAGVTRDPEAVGCGEPIPAEDLIGSEKEKLVFDDIKQIYEWHRA